MCSKENDYIYAVNEGECSESLGNDEQWSGTFDKPDRFGFLFDGFPLVVLLCV
jgi:hypothetical protein